MSALVAVSCPYCGNPVQVQVNERTVTNTAAVQSTHASLTHETSTKGLVQSYGDVECRFCLAKYEFLPNITDYSFIKAHLVPLSPMLENFKKHFPNETLDQIFQDVTGITRPKKPIGDKMLHHPPHLHICFRLNGIRAIADIEQIVPNGKVNKTVLRGLSIEV